MSRSRKFLPAGLPKQVDLLASLICLILAFAFRLPGLTVFLTADEPRSWFGRSIIFLDSLLRADWTNTGPGGAISYIENVSLSPAPGVTTMWTGAIGLVLEYLRQGAPGSLSQFLVNIPFDPLEPAILFMLRLPGVLIAVLAVGLTYWWSRPLLGRWGAFLAAALIALDPFYLALSRILGHDALVSTFMWLSLLAFLRAVNQRMSESANQRISESASQPDNERSGPDSTRNTHYVSRFTFHASRITSHTIFLILSGVFAGFAFLSKYPALFIGAFIAVAMLVVYLKLGFTQHAAGSTQTPRFTFHVSRFSPVLKFWLRDIALWSVAAGLVFVVFWPAMWVNPLDPVMTIINDALRASGGAHQKGSFFLGRPVPDPGVLFYPVVILLRTTPVVFFGLLLSLWLLLRRRMTGAKRKARTEEEVESCATSNGQYAISLILLAYIVLYVLLVTYGGKKQDRYILPAFPAITMLAVVGYSFLSRFTRHASRLKWVLPVALVVIQIVIVSPYHPYYFSYYNPFAGGGRAATGTIQVGWGEGLNEAAAYLNLLPEAETTQVTAWYSTTFEPYFEGQAIYKIDEEKISRSAKPGLAADYVVFYVNQLQRQLPSEGALQYFLSTSPVYTVALNGINYAWVYPSVGMQHVFADEVRLVGQAELLGYDLTDEQGRRVNRAYPESVVYLSLYWEWLGKAAEDPVRISLVDPAGETRGWGNAVETVAPIPFSEWQEGMVVRDDFALVIFPDTPPGEYRLAVWIDRPATGETVGVFPLEDEVIIPVVPR